MRFEGGGKSSVTGAFTRKKWLDQGVFQGDDECYLFQLTPKFRVFSAQRFRRQFPNEADEQAQNYAYLHYFDHYDKNDEELKLLNEIAPSGLGFGGRLVDKLGGGAQRTFRLWVDYQDMQGSSYVNNHNDATFRQGALIDPVLLGDENDDNLAPATKKYKLSYMEVWGIGKENELLSTQLMVEKAK